MQSTFNVSIPSPPIIRTPTPILKWINRPIRPRHPTPSRPRPRRRHRPIKRRMLLNHLHHIPLIRPRRRRHRLLHHNMIISTPSAPLLNDLDSPPVAARPTHPPRQRRLRRHRHGADFDVVGGFVVEPEAEVGQVQEEDEACDAAEDDPCYCSRGGAGVEAAVRGGDGDCCVAAEGGHFFLFSFFFFRFFF